MILHAMLPALMLGVFSLLAAPASAASKKKLKAQPIRVACVGNSITYGTGIEDRARDSYPSQLQRMLGDKYVVGNFGKPGATLLYHGHRPYVVQKEFKEALAFKGDIAVIHLGINDTDPRNWPNYRDEFVKDYLSIMDSLRAANPKVRFILARMTPIADRHPRFISGTKQWHPTPYIPIPREPAYLPRPCTAALRATMADCRCRNFTPTTWYCSATCPLTYMAQPTLARR